MQTSKDKNYCGGGRMRYILITLLLSIPCFAQSYLGNHDYNIRQTINYKDLKTTYEPKTKYREDFQQLLSYAGLDLPKVAEGRYAKTFEKAAKIQTDHGPVLSIKPGTTVECVSKGGDDYQLRSSQPIRMDYGFIMRGTMSNMEVSYNRDDGFLTIQKSDVKDLRGSWGLEKVLGQGRGWDNIRF